MKNWKQKLQEKDRDFLRGKQGMTVREAGRKGGKARAKKLTAKRRKEIARLGYLASPLSGKQESCQPVQSSETK